MVSIFQLKVQLKQFNCSIEGKSGYTKLRHKSNLQKHRETEFEQPRHVEHENYL